MLNNLIIHLLKEKAVKNNDNIYNKELDSFLKFIFWCAKVELLDIITAYGIHIKRSIPNQNHLSQTDILEDVFECLSLKDLPGFFQFLETDLVQVPGYVI